MINALQQWLYPTLPKCSFNLKAKIRIKKQVVIATDTIGGHIRKERIKRNIDQVVLAKKWNMTSVMLSNLELNRKPTPPKYLNQITQFLDYVPKIKMDFDRLGIYTQLFRIDNNISFKELSKQINISQKELKHLEVGKYGKRHRILNEKVTSFLKQNPTSSVMLS